MKKILILIISIIGTLHNLEGTYSLPPSIGCIKNAYVVYKNSTTVTVTPGYGEINGYYWEVTEAYDISLQPPNASDFVYIYIDHSASDYPDIEFLGSMDEPIWSEDKLGWYNGDDRCIGSVYSPANISQIEEFKTIGTVVYYKDIMALISLTNPTSEWYSTTVDVDEITPVNTTRICLTLWAAQSGGVARIRAVPVSYMDQGYVTNSVGCKSYGFCEVWNQWLTVDSNDRSIKVSSDGNDDEMYCDLRGYEYKR